MADLYVKAHTAWACKVGKEDPNSWTPDLIRPSSIQDLYPPGLDQETTLEQGWRFTTPAAASDIAPDGNGTYKLEVKPYDAEEGLHIPIKPQGALRLPKYYVPLAYDESKFQWVSPVEGQRAGYWDHPVVHKDMTPEHSSSSSSSASQRSVGASDEEEELNEKMERLGQAS